MAALPELAEVAELSDVVAVIELGDVVQIDALSNGDAILAELPVLAQVGVGKEAEEKKKRSSNLVANCYLPTPPG